MGRVGARVRLGLRIGRGKVLGYGWMTALLGLGLELGLRKWGFSVGPGLALLLEIGKRLGWVSRVWLGVGWLLLVYRQGVVYIGLGYGYG